MPKLTQQGGVTSIQGTVMVDRDGNVMVMSPAGDFNVVNEPFKAILKDFDGKPVTLQATIKGNDATVESVTGNATANLTVRDVHGKAIGARTDMEEVRITGLTGGKFQIDPARREGLRREDGSLDRERAEPYAWHDGSHAPLGVGRSCREAEDERPSTSTSTTHHSSQSGEPPKIGRREITAEAQRPRRTRRERRRESR